MNSLKHLSLVTTLGVIGSFILVLFGALIAPLILRYSLLPRTVTHQENLDFTFRTCEDQLSGVCSYPEAVLDLNELGIALSPGYYYAMTLTLELFDSEQNGKLGIFQAQLSSKDASGKVISSYKKPLLFRKSFFYSAFITFRNIFFFPLYFLGYFSSSDTVQTILLTNQLYESYTRPTVYLTVQIQNRFVQVASAMLEIRAIVGLSAYLFNEFPILSYISIFGISFAINFGVFLLYWGTKGLSVYVKESDEKEEAENQSGIFGTFFNYIYSFVVPYIPRFLNPKSKEVPRTRTPEPSPDVWNKNEVPESQLIENVPGWDVLPLEDEVDTVKALREEIQKKATVLPDDFMTGTRRRVRAVGTVMIERWEKPHPTHSLCHGFCGKVLMNTSDPELGFTECLACPWGTRALDSSICKDCSQPVEGYDLAFLIFHALAPFLINCLFIKGSSVGSKRQRKFPRIWIVLQFVSAALESSLALILTLLIYKPVGSLTVHTCQKHFLFEWYPMLYNPVINYTQTMKCSSEVVYPLYSLPFANLAFNLGALLVFRTTLYLVSCSKSPKKLPSEPYYAVLWTLPLMTIVHAIFSGVIYYSFPYILLFSSLTLNALHFAYEGRKNIHQLIESMFKDPEHLLILIFHMALFGFSLYSLYLSIPSYLQLPRTKAYGLIGALLPLPSMFYILTVKLTIPSLPRAYPSLFNLLAVRYMYGKMKKEIDDECRMKNVWINYSIIGSVVWICSISFHSRDFWLTEYLDYFAACGLICYAFFAALSFTVPWFQKSTKGHKLWKTIGAGILFFYLYHVISLLMNFDYGHNMKYCIAISVTTAFIYISWAAKEMASGRTRKSLFILLLTIAVGLGSAGFEVLDFPPIFWVFDAHSLFHAATIPTPFLLAKFAVDESRYEMNKKIFIGKSV
ncbi:hypothetical protein FO519_000150 [Halicephalobus sp. NKZ332]|nr:hypothetical protein FO519_000150 [Halicephalobus sp. NKZ332]